VPGPPPAVVVPITFANLLEHSMSGVEFAAEARPLRTFRLHGSYSWLTKWNRRGGSREGLLPGGGDSVGHMLKLAPSCDLTRRSRLDMNFFRMSRLLDTDVPAYLRADLRFALRFGEAGEWSFGVQNAFDDRHPEFMGADYVLAAEAKRALYVAVTWGQ
jgi:outer membrane receptor protein involved in Fe transport